MLIRSFTTFLLRTILIVLTLLMILSLSTLAFPLFELINDLRLFLIAALLVLLFLTVIFWLESLILWVIGLLALNLILFVTPLYFIGFTKSVEPVVVGKSPLKLLSFNMIGVKNNGQDLENFLRQNKPDIVILHNAKSESLALINNLKDLYPHNIHCVETSCQFVLLSRFPWLMAGKQDKTVNHPALIWAKFMGPEKTFRIVGTTLSHISSPFAQHTEVDWLIQHTQSIREPFLIAGEFNVTAWSWNMSRMGLYTDAKRHPNDLVEWPEGQYIPHFLKAHILSNEGILNLGTTLGPKLYDTYRPVMTRISFP